MTGLFLAPIVAWLAATPAQAGDVTFMGWGDVYLRRSELPEEPLHFDQGHLYLLADARVNSAWSLFTEVELEHLPSVKAGQTHGEIAADRVYIEVASDLGRLRFGKVNTPFGIRVPTHWALLTPMVSKPAIEGMADVQHHIVGVEAHAELPLGNHELAMTAVVHNGMEESGTGDPVDGLTGAAGDLALTLSSVHRVGASFFRRGDLGVSGAGQHSFAGYVDLVLPANLHLRAESARFHAYTPDVHSTHYALCTYTLHFYDPVTLGYRLGFGSSQYVSDFADAVAHTANLSWVPADSVRTVLEYEQAADLDGELVARGMLLWLGASF